MLPFGIIEKHGPQLPLGTDLINVRYTTEHAAAEEYAVIFPPTILDRSLKQSTNPAPSPTACTCNSICCRKRPTRWPAMAARRSLSSTVMAAMRVFCLISLSRSYKQNTITSSTFIAGMPIIPVVPLHSKVDMHAGESETAHTMVSRPDLVHQDRATQESGADQAREHLPQDVYTGIWWYARFPNHYSGDGSAATLELGQDDMKANISDLADAIRAIKADQTSLQLQNEFFEKAQHPLDTKQ